MEVTHNYEDGTQSKFVIESDLNGSLEVEDNEVGDTEEVTKPNENVDSVHSRMRQELISVIGIEFKTEDDAYPYFYNRYAYRFGFSTRKSKAHKGVNGILCLVLFLFLL